MKKFFTLTLALLASFSLWANQTDLISGVTLPDIPASSLDMATQTFKTPDANGWIVMEPNADIRNASVTWFTAMAWNTSSQSVDVTKYSFTAPFVTLSSVSCTTVQQTARTKAIRFTGASDVSFLVTSGGSRTIYVSLYSYSNNTQSLIETKSADNNWTELLFSSLNLSTDYVAYMYESTNSNGVVGEIALKRPVCNAPANALVLSADKTSDIYAGDEITFSTTGGNGGAITIEGADSETITANKWIAVAGTHTFTASQAKNGDYCEQESELVLTVASATPVTTCAITGPTAGYVGYELTYTATAANAAAYEWYLDGVKQGSDSAKFIYTAVKGSHSIVCRARNQFNVDPYPEWISSDAKALTVTNVSGTLVSFIVNSDANGAANLSGVLAADANAKVALTKGSSQALDEYTGYKMDRGKYVGVTLSQGSFAEGDTVSFMVTKASGTAKLYLYNDEKGTNRLDSIEFSGQTGWATFVLNQTTTGVYLYRSDPDVKPYDQNPYVAAVKVIRPMPIKSTVITLSNVKINGTSISAANLASLQSTHSLALEDSYLDAPKVKFFKTTTITYEDDSQKSTTDSTEVTASVVDSKWQAQATIAEVLYTVTMAKTASFVVTYKHGETTLGTENVEANDNPANYATYQTLNDGGLSTFGGWYNDADLAAGHAVADISAEVITANTTYYAKFTYIYATSVNIEQWILDNGAGKGSTTKTSALLSLLGTDKFASNLEWENQNVELDSLDDGKGDRNEPYLGLKVKKTGSLINFRLTEGSYVKIKFGAIKTEKPQVSINGGEYTDVTLTSKVYSYTATGEDLVSIKTVSNNAVVFKQIMINEDIKPVTLPDVPTSVDNVETSSKAVKVLKNGVLFIEKNGKVYNAQGQIAK